MKTLLKFIIGIPIILYIGICIILYIYQDKLLFFPSELYIPHYEKIKKDTSLKNYQLQTKDGYILDGWAQINPINEKTILYFGGNGDEISYFIEKHKFKGVNLIAFNYRGYAYSTGYPSEKNLFQDADQIYDFITQDLKIDTNNLFVMGRSLGTGVATYLAGHKNFAGVILVTPYYSVESIAAEAYSFIPVSLLLKNKFQSYKYATVQLNRALIIYGGQDLTIPNSSTERLISIWKGDTQKLFLEEANHNNIYSFPQVQKNIESFIR